MAPTVVRDGGHANVLVIGSPGGPRIITSIAQVLLRWIVLEEPLDRAVAAPHLHQQWSPPATRFEPGFDPRLVAALRERFAQPVEQATTRFGSVQAIGLERIGAEPVAVSDPRRGGTGAVVGRTPSQPARPSTP
jgi:gamma-glutamyltranspeptidase/glutathione hydrolase